jgi:hypothetical protein
MEPVNREPLQQQFVSLVKAEYPSLVKDFLKLIPPARKQTPVDMVSDLVDVTKETFHYAFYDLPYHTFSCTTFFYVIAELKKTICANLREKLGSKHIYVHSLSGELREATDNEMLCAWFDGERMTKFSITIEAYTWGNQ